MTPERGQQEVSVPSLSIGNIVTIGVQLTRLNFNDQFVRSLLANALLWAALIIGTLVVVVAVAIGIGLDVSSNSQPLFTLITAGISTLLVLPLVLFPMARMTAVGALMSRMGVNTLQRRVEPEELFRQKILKRVWDYLLAAIALGAFLVVVFGGVIGLLGALGWTLLLPFWNNFEPQISDPRLQWTLGVAALLLFLLFLLGLGAIAYYLTARLSFFDTVLALEENRTPIEALQRSWALTTGKGWSITTVMFVAGMVTVPLSVLGSLINIFVPLVSIVLAVVLFPYWQAIKAVNYYDLAALNDGLIFDLFILPQNPRRFLRRVAIQTPEGIELDFTLGGIGSRTLAWILDQLIVYLGLAVLTYVGAILYVFALLPVITDRFAFVATEDVNLWAGAIALFLQFLLVNGYYIYWETVWRGQTPGKRFAKIRVIRDDGQAIGIKEAALRSFIGWLDLGLLFIGVPLILLGQSEKRLGDYAGGTLVIQDEKAQQQRSFTIPTSFSTLTEDSLAVVQAHADADCLSLEQYFILRDFLGYRPQLSPAARNQVTQRLARQLRSLLTPQPELLGAVPDENLVEAVYLACQHLYQRA